ncbi:MAG: GAF domain-containing protein [Longimicrobiales bacterium]
MSDAEAIDAVAVDEALRQQESLLAFVASISRELELQPLLTLILQHACDLIGADVGTIGLYDAERRVVRTEAVYNMPPDELGTERPEGVGLSGETVQRGVPVLIDRYGDLPRPTQLSMVENSVIGMPIHWNGQLIGAFGVGAYPDAADSGGETRRHHFTEADINMLALFARHAAIAIANARRYALEHVRKERLSLIARIGSIVTADLRLGELLQNAADAIHELLGYQNVAIPLVDRDDPDTLVLRTVGGHYKSIVRGEYRIPVTQGIMGAAVRTREPILVNDVASDPRHLPTPGATGITAELAVPILLGERVLGVLNVEGEDRFTEDDAASLRIVADQLAVAIENARLYGDARRLAIVEERQRVARELHDSVTQQLVGMVLIGESLAPAYRREPDEGTRRVDRVLALGRAALGEMRALVAELRPSDSSAPPEPVQPQPASRVRTDGLVTALYHHVNEHAAELPEVRIETAGYVARETHIEETLFRIAQEALNNVIKHAQASLVTITLESSKSFTRVTIHDNGDGFVRDGRRRPARSRQGSGLGLSIMKERAESAGGSLTIESEPGKGTTLRVRVPL